MQVIGIIYTVSPVSLQSRHSCIPSPIPPTLWDSGTNWHLQDEEKWKPLSEGKEGGRCAAPVEAGLSKVGGRNTGESLIVKLDQPDHRRVKLGCMNTKTVRDTSEVKHGGYNSCDLYNKTSMCHAFCV